MQELCARRNTQNSSKCAEKKYTESTAIARGQRGKRPNIHVHRGGVHIRNALEIHVRADAHEVWRSLPHVLAVVDNHHHAVTAREQRLERRRLEVLCGEGVRVCAFVRAN